MRSEHFYKYYKIAPDYDISNDDSETLDGYKCHKSLLFKSDVQKAWLALMVVVRQVKKLQCCVVDGAGAGELVSDWSTANWQLPIGFDQSQSSDVIGLDAGAVPHKRYYTKNE